MTEGQNEVKVTLFMILICNLNSNFIWVFINFCYIFYIICMLSKANSVYRF